MSLKLPDGSVLMHAGAPYDPVKAHEYYLRTRKLSGRKKGSAQPATSGLGTPAAPKPANNAQKKRELAARIQGLERKLQDLEALIAKKERDSEEEAKKSAKEAAKPPTAAEKAEKARDAKKFRDKHKQEIKSNAKAAASKSGGSSTATKSKDSTSGQGITELKELATKVKGQLAVAKSKLRAL